MIKRYTSEQKKRIIGIMAPAIGEGLTHRQITEALNMRGITNTQGAPFTEAQVRSLARTFRLTRRRNKVTRLSYRPAQAIEPSVDQAALSQQLASIDQKLNALIAANKLSELGLSGSKLSKIAEILGS